MSTGHQEYCNADNLWNKEMIDTITTIIRTMKHWIIIPMHWYQYRIISIHGNLYQAWKTLLKQGDLKQSLQDLILHYWAASLTASQTVLKTVDLQLHSNYSWKKGI